MYNKTEKKIGNNKFSIIIFENRKKVDDFFIKVSEVTYYTEKNRGVTIFFSRQAQLTPSLLY